ncbi:hypothetical protein CDAR_528061 [Caerostris darwini]|uniref:Uncharacterized protein n=1 Tax=Caerostris darwini TaxID=1538125 RepID=A0AAV4RFM2_9ARAC|nr:hypothetical protein CDAR_528061 [Caerostris darwini]
METALSRVYHEGVPECTTLHPHFANQIWAKRLRIFTFLLELTRRTIRFADLWSSTLPQALKLSVRQKCCKVPDKAAPGTLIFTCDSS